MRLLLSLLLVSALRQTDSGRSNDIDIEREEEETLNLESHLKCISHMNRTSHYQLCNNLIYLLL